MLHSSPAPGFQSSDGLFSSRKMWEHKICLKNSQINVVYSHWNALKIPSMFAKMFTTGSSEFKQLLGSTAPKRRFAAPKSIPIQQFVGAIAACGLCAFEVDWLRLFSDILALVCCKNWKLKFAVNCLLQNKKCFLRNSKNKNYYCKNVKFLNR